MNKKALAITAALIVNPTAFATTIISGEWNTDTDTWEQGVTIQSEKGTFFHMRADTDEGGALGIGKTVEMSDTIFVSPYAEISTEDGINQEIQIGATVAYSPTTVTTIWFGATTSWVDREGITSIDYENGILQEIDTNSKNREYFVGASHSLNDNLNLMAGYMHSRHEWDSSLAGEQDSHENQWTVKIGYSIYTTVGEIEPYVRYEHTNNSLAANTDNIWFTGINFTF